MYRIRRFGVVQTATTVAAIYIFVVAIFAIPGAILVSASGSGSNGSGALGLVIIAVLAAALYGIVGWIVTAIGCAVYNVVSGWVGGIEVQIDPVAPPPAAPSWGPITPPAPPTTPTAPTAPAPPV
jgi:hypothetical protein